MSDAPPTNEPQPAPAPDEEVAGIGPRGPGVAGFLAGLFLAEFAHAALIFILLPSHVATKLQAGLGWAGLAGSAYYLADLLLKTPAGWLADRWGRRRAMLASMVGSALTFVVAALMPSAPLLVLACLLHGATAAPMWPSVLAAVADTSSSGERGGAVGKVFTVWFAGSAAGFLTMSLLHGLPEARRLSLLGLVWVAAALAATVWAQEPARRYHGEALPTPLGPRAAARALRRHLRRLRWLLAGMMAQSLSLGLLVQIVDPFARQYLGLRGWEPAVALALGGGATLALLIPLGRLGDRMGPRRLLVSGLALCGAVLLLLPLCRHLLLVAAAAALLGTSYALILPAWNKTLLAHTPPGGRGVLMGAFMTIEGTGLSVGVAASGHLWELLGPPAPFLLAGTALCLVALAYSVYMPPTLEALQERGQP